ncbi:SHOCT domain-containing protein [Enterococcus sp. AZ103]|uniref:SHOCT domain-containing protein n=1 Tax=Enterococcus sp. AZ103 TaxID=2774628 RepID=UPI003F28D5C5
MGLFKNQAPKQCCPLCNKKFSIINFKFQLNSNDYICTQCAIFLAGMSKEDQDKLKPKSIFELQEMYVNKKESITEKLDHFSQFSPNIKVGTWAEFDDNHKIAAFRTGLSAQPNSKYLYDDIEDFSVIENEKKIVKSGAASAAAGAILFGPTGAIVGGLMTRGNKKETCSMLKVTIFTKNDKPKDIVLINSKVKIDSSLYKLSQGSLKSIVTKLESIIQPNKDSINNHQSNYSDADELRKYKQLLDDGIITQEDFDSKKKKILDL